MISFIVEEIVGCPLSDALNGEMLTLFHSQDFYTRPTYGAPSIRVYDGRVTGRRRLGSKGLKQSCRALHSLFE